MSKSNDEIHDTDLQAPTHLLKRSPYLLGYKGIDQRTNDNPSSKQCSMS